MAYPNPLLPPVITAFMPTKIAIFGQRMSTAKRILVAPLNWGIGHATRCIPIIKALQSEGFEVVIGASNKPLALLKREFPEVECILLPGMDVAYPKWLPMSIYMAFRAPSFFKWIRLEKKILESIIKNYRIDAVISDNRYGLSTDLVPTVFITHQLFIKAGVFSWFLKKLTHHYAKAFNYCWVPDDEGDDNLSGSLSHGKTTLERLRFAGPLSRFNYPNYHKPNIRYDLLVILSGPEPSRTILENTLLRQFQQTKLKILFVRGKVDSEIENEETIHNVVKLNYLNSSDMQRAILMSRVVLCRPGYSSIMDLAALRSKALFIPTNGQTEQEYLAKKMMKQDIALYVKRHHLKLEAHYEEALKYSGFTERSTASNLLTCIKELKSHLNEQAVNGLSNVG